MTTATTGWQRPRPVGLHRAITARSLITPRIRKELRVIVPYFAGVFAILVILFLTPKLLPYSHSAAAEAGVGAFAIFCLGILPFAVGAMCLQLWLAEFQSGTIVELLTQPISRRRLWYTKFTMAAVAVALGLAAAFALTLLPHSDLIENATVFSYLALVLCAAPGIAVSLRRPMASLLMLILFLIASFIIVNWFRAKFFGPTDSSSLQSFCDLLACVSPLAALWIYYTSRSLLALIAYAVLCSAIFGNIGNLLQAASFPAGILPVAKYEVVQQVKLDTWLRALLALISYCESYRRFLRLEVR